MDMRNIQKTGNMHYIYLPTSWCKKYNINSDTKVSLAVNNDGSISIFPGVKEAERKSIDIILPEVTPNSLIKLIIACYINPTKSFRIRLKKETDLSKILDKKKPISALEFVELDGNSITHESSSFVKDPYSLLKTMVNKVKNLVSVMIEHYDKESINRYEEEIDKSKLLISKSVISSLVLNEPTRFKTVDLHYMALLNRDLERMVDSLIFVEKKETAFLKKTLQIVNNIQLLLEDLNKLDFNSVIKLEKNISLLKAPEVDNIKTYGLRRIKKHFANISEIFFDWAVTTELLKGK